MSLIWPDWPAPANVLAVSTTRQSEGLPEALAVMSLPAIRQVHGNVVLDAGQVAEGAEADAVYSFSAGIGCRVVTADCLPVLFCDRAGTRIAAAHAGWRGLAAGVLENTVDALGGDPGDLLAWIGPAISQACYEVGGDVLEAFLAASPAGLAAATEACFAPRDGKFLADLPGIARARLRHRGVAAVYGGDHCTFSDAGRFHSFRRDGAAAGRQSAVICLLPAGD